ncbi:YicC family protein [Snodgrassella communis]|uniref:YicC family protein n=2 Tax=Snodgrassella TaxID=1193515 RepID=A0A2N9WMR1_9NEIS|nr:YicC family protein [Snodgrassella communis]PIT47959.1 YicC family protein [Snodgrassella alvi]PIT09741.1 YicC family protein [Snodgrassella communis]PIT22926.1 YicC family protein [Snodgrassella communis]PIT24102.1 YicC family protein [Snodgrassella communis]
MTGYANASGQFGNRQINIELRAVNHRYLDIQFKVVEELRRFEGQMRELINAQVARGKLECRVQIKQLPSQNTEDLPIDHKLVKQLAVFNQQIRRQYKDLGKLTVADILHFPGVIVATTEDEEVLLNGVLTLLKQVLTEFKTARAREGEKLQQHLLSRLNDMSDIVAAMQQLFPQLLQDYMNKAETRLREAVAQVDAERLKQEFVLFMQKADVDEELNRLTTHIAEARRLIEEHRGSVGKRLDFLMQELNREANTLGSKAIAIECTQASVGLKVLIEQMREQVQNIE